jgi:L-aspartate oxidase
VGEVACTGLHGANRLASTSLLEGLVWGYRAARHLAVQGLDRPTVSIPPWQEETGRVDPALVAQDESTIRTTMWNYVGLARSTGRLQRARSDLIELRQTIDSFYRHARLTDSLIGLRNMSEVALLITQAAWHNKTSRGCHFRED